MSCSLPGGRAAGGRPTLLSLPGRAARRPAGPKRSQPRGRRCVCQGRLPEVPPRVWPFGGYGKALRHRAPGRAPQL